MGIVPCVGQKFIHIPTERNGTMADVTIDGVRYRPVNEDEARELAEYIREFTLEGSDYWRKLFITSDTTDDGSTRFGMYNEGDEAAPFFSEAFLYNLLGKDEARSVLGIVRRLCVLAGVEQR
jgi:hypothetical protein